MKRKTQFSGFTGLLFMAVLALISILDCNNSKAKSEFVPKNELPQPREIVQSKTSLAGEPDVDSKGEWPQWRGPNRDGISTETGLLKTWSKSGPKVLWRMPIGEGYSGISISQGRIYTMDVKGNDEFVVCFNASNGKELWRFKSDRNFRDSHGDGPRSTPTIDGDLVFSLGALGKLYALNSKTGEKVWEHDLVKEFGGRVPTWGYSSSPLIEGDLLLIEVGGKSGSALVAFNKRTGSVVWKSYDGIAGYSSPIAITVDGIRQIIFFMGTSVVSVSPTDGKFYWKYNWETSYDVNSATPIFIPPDKVFISSNYGKGAAVFQITTDNGKVTAEPVWKSRVMKNHFSSSILYGDYIYGFDSAILKCIEADSGEEKWKERGFGKGSLMLADGHLIVLGDRGKLALVEATPSRYIEQARAQVLRKKCWTMPTLAGGKLYLRNQKEIVCLNMTG